MDLRGSHKYGHVLVAITLPLLFALSFPEQEATRVAAVILSSLALLFSLFVVEAVRRAFYVGIPLVAIAIGAAIFSAIDTTDASLAAVRIATGLLILLAPAVIVRGLLRHLRQVGRVTLQAVFGAVTIYILIGEFFAALDAAVDTLTNQPFFQQQGAVGFHEFLYFSFVTLATLGYGDLTPAFPVAKMLSVTEAISGQLYLVTVIAVMVSNVGRGQPGGGENPRSQEDG